MRSACDDHLTLGRERAGEPVQRFDGGNDFFALLIQDADEFVEPCQQFADVVLMSRQRRAEVVDDVTDLAQATGIETTDSADSVCSVDG